MSVEGEKTCPLCAEEMDLTDQQLKPCKCGYEICVWCWHHIMDMAEKDKTEGRCPACRTLYNKEKIVGMAAKCERLVAEMSMERKVKSQKAKIKTSEGRKQLSSVRVIQRNLVYIVGLPLDLADEDLLQCKEYFGQYGKVLKVSISRTAAGAIQHFANNTCNVYVTYSKDDEAIRCIQSVHGFVLEDRSLSNLDCLYLHEIGLQEDSFTKDEIISAYTRVQQIIGATNDMQRRSGNMLPPPTDECCNNGSTSSGKPISRIVTNNQTSIVGDSPPNSSNGRSIALPVAASWGKRCQPPSASLAYSKGPSKQKPDASGSLAFSTAVTSPPQVSVLHGDIGKKAYEESRTSQQKGKLEPVEYMKQYTGADHRRTTPETPVAPGLPVTSTMSSQFVTPTSEDKYKSVNMPPNVQNICSDMSSMSIDRHQGLQRCDAEQFRETMVSVEAGRAATSINDVSVAREQPDFRSDLQSRVAEVPFQEVEEDLLSFDDQRLKDPEVLTQKSYLPNSNHSFHNLNDSSCYSPQQSSGPLNGNVDPPVVNKKLNTGSLSYACSIPVISNGYPEKVVSSRDLASSVEHSHLLPNEGKRKHVGRFEDEVAKVNCDATVDMGESHIISNILSMDFDSWDESLTSPQNLAKLLGETDKRKGSLRVSSSWKVQNSNQSRFSFAREEECINQVSDVEPSCGNIGQALKNSPFNHDFVKNRCFYLEKTGNCNGFSSVGVEESNNFAGGHSLISSKISLSRAQMSAPPGFSVPCRAPPPGFSSHERMEQTFDTLSGNHLLNTSSLLRKPYQTPPAVNMGSTVDIEFLDPAILAVGRGRFPGGLSSPATDTRSKFPLQFSAFENEARLQLMMQRFLSPHQNQR